MYEQFAPHLQEIRTLLGADRLCFWRQGADGAAQPVAGAPADWLQRPFQAPASDGVLELVTGPAVRARLPLAARGALPADLEGAALALVRRGPQAGFFAFWRDAAAVPADLPRLVAMVSLNWDMVVRAQERIDKIRSASNQLDSLVAALPQGVALVAPAGRPGLVNGPAARWLGLEAGSVDSAALAEALHRWMHRAGNLGERSESIGAVLRGGPGQAGGFHLEFSDPHLVVQVTLAPIGEGGGAGGGWVWLMQDVTCEREDAERLQQALDEAARANAAKSAFLATMSHELRTPLNAVLGFSRLLEDSLPDPQARQQARYIRETGETLATILNDVLDLAKIEAGKFDLDPRPFELRQVFESCASIFRKLAADRGIEFALDLPTDLPPLVGDPVRLRQIVQNLLSNAFKFTAKGRVAMSLQAVGEVELPGGAKGLQLRLQVSDTGIGMTPEQLQRVFQRFEQAERTIASRYGGTGLGLAISQALAQMMHGQLAVASTYGRGTTFTLTLALEYAAALEPGTPAPEAAPQEPPLRVLVVDDMALNRQVIRALLERRGHRVLEAEDGVQALERFDADAPDLVLMDLDMPRLDGLEATRRIRAHGELGRDVPIYALTGKAFAEDIALSLEAGMDGHLAKPFQHDELVQVLQRTAARLSGASSA